MIKVVFFDLDGTVLSHTKFGVPESCKQAIKQLQSQGIKCVLATGRHIVEVRELPVDDIHFDGYLLVNCQIFLDENQNFIDGIEIKEKEKEEVVRLFNQKKYPVFLNEIDRIYANMSRDDYDYTFSGSQFSMFPILEYTGNPIYQAIVFVDKEHEEEILKQVPSMSTARWSDLAVDLVNNGNNKGTGIKRWCDLMGYSLDETMCFGDGENDIPMLKVCNYAVAMGNGNPLAKKQANHITTHIDEDGIVEGLKSFGLLNQDNLVKDTLTFVKEYFNDDFSGHDYQHTSRVYNLACNIANQYQCDKTKVKLAALLHDVDDRKLAKGNHENFENTINYLKSKGLADLYIEEIVHIIKQVSFKGNDSVVPDTIEGKIVQDADRLDAIGAIGIARTFAYGGAKGNPMYDPDIKPLINMDENTYFNHKSTTINHFYEKLLLLKDMMNTEVAEQLANNRTKVMEDFLKEFFAEYNGEL